MIQQLLPYELPPMRPPSEARSLLVRVMRGCPWNYCTFCSAYKDIPRRLLLRSVEDVKADINSLRTVFEEFQSQGRAVPPTTAFLGDSNALITRTTDLVEIIRHLYHCFPSIERLTSYARAKTILVKKPAELDTLREAGLTRLHVGLESGDDGVLARTRKGATAAEMVAAGRRAKEHGFELSMYVMPGLGGRDRSEAHVDGTARVLNAVQPHYTRMRPLMIAPGTPLAAQYHAGTFKPLSRLEVIEEMRKLVARLDLEGHVCFDHYANPPFLRQEWEGYIFPHEREELLSTLDQGLARMRRAAAEAGPMLGAP